MRLPAAYFAACLAIAGCAPPNNATTAATSADTLSFSSGASFTPTTPIDNTQVTITWTVYNSSTNNTPVTNVPYVINRDGHAYTSLTIASVPPNAATLVNFMITETDSQFHTYEMVLDPNDLTGAISTSNNTNSIQVPWSPAGSG